MRMAKISQHTHLKPRPFQFAFARCLVYFCFALLWVSCTASALLDSNSFDSGKNGESVREGELLYDQWKSDSTKPRYGQCWLEGLTMLETGCKRLTRETQHSMALKFTNCFLEETGRDTQLSTVEMSENMLSIYSGFFRHTQNVCYFLMSQIWQEETDLTINRLADNSATVANQLANSSELQGEIILRQNESLKNQELLISKGAELKHTLEASADGVQDMMEEFREATSKQREMIFEVFDRVSSLQEIVMGEFTGFYSLLFYTISILISYLLTSTARTSGARFWLFVLMTVNVVIERLVVMWGVPEGAVESGVFESSFVYGRLWWCRKISSSLGVVIWGVIAYRFQDYNKINNQLLIEIQRQNSDLKRLLETGSNANTPTTVVPNGFLPGRNPLDRSGLFINNLDLVDHSEGTLGISVTTMDRHSNSSTGYESDSDFESVSSFDSRMTDHTFNADDEEDLSDTESVVSTASRLSLNQIPEDELRYLRQATPLRDMTPDTSSNSMLNISLDSIGFKRPGRPRGRRSEPVKPIQPHHYNLRNRKGRINKSLNPVVDNETPIDFGKTVKHLEQIALRNCRKAKVTLQRNKRDSNFFSSDDDA